MPPACHINSQDDVWHGRGAKDPLVRGGGAGTGAQNPAYQRNSSHPPEGEHDVCSVRGCHSCHQQSTVKLGGNEVSTDGGSHPGRTAQYERWTQVEASLPAEGSAEEANQGRELLAQIL